MPPTKFYCCAILIVEFLIGLCKPDTATAQTFFGASPEATGLAGRAAINSVDSHYLNPAAIVFGKPYHFGVTYKTERPTLGNPENAYNVVIIDNNPEKLVSASFGYLYERRSFPETTIVDQDFSLDVASRVMPTVSLGLQGRRLVRSNSNGPAFTKHNLTFGVLVVPLQFLGFSFVAYDMLTDDDLDMIPTLSLGSHIILFQILRFRADVTRQEKRNPEKKGSLNTGLEIDLGSGLLARTGVAWDTLNRNTYWTGGIAFDGPRLSGAYAYRAETEKTGEYTHTLQATLNF